MKGPTVIVFPDFRRSNLYQSLLYKALPRGMNARFATLDQALARAKQGETIVFHLHWTAPLFDGCDDEESFARESEAIVRKIGALQALGGRLVWTIHNILPHHRRFRDAEIRFRTRLSAVADVIHIHDAAAQPRIEAVYPLPADKIVVAPHGHLIGAYRMPWFTSFTRRRLGLGKDDIVAGVIGQLRPNKGVEDLIEAAPLAQGLQTIVAGRVTKPAKVGDFARRCAANGVVCREGFIRKSQFAAYVALPDVHVLPYREILTSGSLVMALSSAKPVILPDLPSFAHLKGQPFAWFYTPGAPGTLAEALNEAASKGQAGLKALGQQAFDYAKPIDWSKTITPILNALNLS